MTESTDQGVRVNRAAAFLVNGVGMAAEPFPLSFSVAAEGAVTTVDGAAAGLSELVDVLTAHARPYAVVLNVGTNSFLDEDWQQWPLGRIAREQGVDADVHDIRWAAAPRFLSDDLLVLPKAELPKLIEGWYPYDIEVFDAARPLSPAEVDEFALVVNTHDHRTPVLPLVPGASLVFNGHDDCYLSVETTTRGLPQALLTRLLTLQAGAALLATGDADETGDDAVVVIPPPAELVSGLLRDGDHWVGRIAEARPGERARLELAPTSSRWRLGSRLPDDMPCSMTYDVAAGTWTVTGLS